MCWSRSGGAVAGGLSRALQEKLKEFLRRKETGDLSLTRTQLQLGASTAPVATAAMRDDGSIHIGDAVVVRHAHSNAALAVGGPLFGSSDLAVAGAPAAGATRRTVLTIQAVDGASGALCFGQPFRIAHAPDEPAHSYFYTERVSLFGGNAKKATDQQAVVLRPGAPSYGLDRLID